MSKFYNCIKFKYFLSLSTMYLGTGTGLAYISYQEYKSARKYYVKKFFKNYKISSNNYFKVREETNYLLNLMKKQCLHTIYLWPFELYQNNKNEIEFGSLYIEAPCPPNNLTPGLLLPNNIKK